MTFDTENLALTQAIPSVLPSWSWRDYRGAFAVRWCVYRNTYSIPPGVYAMHAPTADSPILVTSNYKLSFDHLRRALSGIAAWILVLDTKGINVWCAAGKGTFGTDELVNRLHETQMAQQVTHRVVVVPQLGAPGVTAHEVLKRTGFKVVYGPVYACDLPAFLSAGMKAEPQMRRIGFSLGERLAVTPVELVQRFPQALLLLLLFVASAGLGQQGTRDIVEQGPWIALAVGSNFVTGLVLIPVLLPWLPGRAFAWKGLAAGLLLGLALAWFWPFGNVAALSVALLSVATCSFLSLMFTGCTPYTSASGVRREMRWALPMQGGLAFCGLAGWFVSRFI
jgi:acetyl-CoA decarbonylase/synthase complex subunit gamma